MIIGQLWRCPQMGLQPNKIKREILGEDVSFYSKEVSTGIPIKLWVLQLGRKKALNKSRELCWNLTSQLVKASSGFQGRGVCKDTASPAPPCSCHHMPMGFHHSILPQPDSLTKQQSKNKPRTTHTKDTMGLEQWLRG